MTSRTVLATRKREQRAKQELYESMSLRSSPWNSQRFVASLRYFGATLIPTAALLVVVFAGRRDQEERRVLKKTEGGQGKSAGRQQGGAPEEGFRVRRERLRGLEEAVDFDIFNMVYGIGIFEIKAPGFDKISPIPSHRLLHLFHHPTPLLCVPPQTSSFTPPST